MPADEMRCGHSGECWYENSRSRCREEGVQPGSTAALRLRARSSAWLPEPNDRYLFRCGCIVIHRSHSCRRLIPMLIHITNIKPSPAASIRPRAQLARCLCDKQNLTGVGNMRITKTLLLASVALGAICASEAASAQTIIRGGGSTFISVAATQSVRLRDPPAHWPDRCQSHWFSDAAALGFVCRHWPGFPA